MNWKKNGAYQYYPTGMYTYVRQWKIKRLEMSWKVLQVCCRPKQFQI